MSLQRFHWHKIGHLDYRKSKQPWWSYSFPPHSFLPSLGAARSLEEIFKSRLKRVNTTNFCQFGSLLLMASKKWPSKIEIIKIEIYTVSDCNLKQHWSNTAIRQETKSPDPIISNYWQNVIHHYIYTLL